MSSQLSSAVSAFHLATEPQPSNEMVHIDSMLKTIASTLSEKALTSTDALAALDHLRVAREYSARALDPRTDSEQEAEVLAAVGAIRKASEPEDAPETNPAPAIPETESADETANIEAAQSASG